MVTAEKDYYRVLGLHPNATVAEIRQAYRRKAMQCHHDRGGRHEAMVEVCEAAEVLLNPKLRAMYDRVRKKPEESATQDRWRSTAQQAHAKAEHYPVTWAGFESWLEKSSGNVRKTQRGRAAAGMAAGAILGGIAGALAGWSLELSPLVCMGLGAGAGAVGGAFAGATSRHGDATANTNNSAGK